MATAAQTSLRQELVVIGQELVNQEKTFSERLPSHVTPRQFIRVVMQVLQEKPDLLRCDRVSLFNACKRAAASGLMPDGKEGAIVPYKGQATWVPMVYGIRKLVRNSGEVLDWDVHLVYANDKCTIRLGDNPSIDHVVAIGDRGVPLGGYAIANFKNGGTSREWMSIGDIEGIRQRSSKAQQGPWHIEEFHPEMCRKTIAHRHVKVLPQSPELEKFVRAQDEDEMEETAGERMNLETALDHLANTAAPPADSNGKTIEHHPETGEVQDTAAKSQENGATNGKAAAPKATAKAAAKTKQAEPEGDGRPEPPPQGEKVEQVIQTESAKTETAQDESPKLPANTQEYTVYARAWFASHPVDDLQTRWKSPAEKTIRNKANIDPDIRDELYSEMIAIEGKRRK